MPKHIVGIHARYWAAERLTAELFDGQTWWYEDGMRLGDLVSVLRALSLVKRITLILVDGDEGECPVEAHVFHDGSAILLTDSYWDILCPVDEGHGANAPRRLRGGAGLFETVS